jgi:hypothetical protein
VSRIVTKIGDCRQRKWSIHMETINGEDASGGPYASALKINFDASPDFKHLVCSTKNKCKPVEPEKNRA